VFIAMPRLSVAISAYDQHEVTVLHVDACFRSKYVPHEVIVVNDGGDDSLREMLRAIPNKTCPVIYSRVKTDVRWNYTGARNLGLFISSGDVVAIEDNDHIPDREYYQGAMEMIAEGYDVVFPRNRTFVLKEGIRGREMENWVPLKGKGPHSTVSVMKREVLLKLKGFDENFAGHYGWNGTNWTKKLKRLAPKIVKKGHQFMVLDSFSRTEDRPQTPGGKYRAESHNYRYLQKNLRKEELQSDKGILNFNYDYEVMK